MPAGQDRAFCALFCHSRALLKSRIGKPSPSRVVLTVQGAAILRGAVKTGSGAEAPARPREFQERNWAAERPVEPNMTLEEALKILGRLRSWQH